jgi:hypothetical protein
MNYLELDLEGKSAFKILTGKPKGKRPLGGIDGEY